RHTRSKRDWSSDVCSSDLEIGAAGSGSFEVINAGYPGTCLGEKAAWYERGVRPLHPSLVVLTLLGDDVDGDLFWRVFSLDAEGQIGRASCRERGWRGESAS